mgnify:CR=1 FL=1|tara:strand:+ start:543 stop:1124 length:582 start_codon:yes stop_codon:yes gene_type:complete
MKRWLNILIIVCVLLTASSLKAQDRPLPESQEDYYWEDDAIIRNQAFLEIKAFEKQSISVTFVGSAKRIGLNKRELTDYLRLSIKNNFADITIANTLKEFFKFTGKQQGGISLRIWISGDDYPVAYHLKYKFFNYEYRYHQGRPEGERIKHSIWEDEMLGIGLRENVSDLIKKSIDDVIPELAILFYKARGKL